MILSIPICANVADSCHWRGEKLGQYSVRSAYRMLQMGKNTNQTSYNSDFLRKLWNLKVPPKVKNLLWRASTDCLPAKVQLRTKRVDVNVTCSICYEEP